MPISLLYPLALLGALAVAAPLWLHLRRKTESNLIRFSALQFLDDQPQARRSPWRLRDLVLFALRVLALLLLVCAFAWPYRPQGQSLVVQESRVYVLDNTLSHQAGDGFTRDRERILQEIARAGSDVQIAVVELTSLPRVLIGFGDNRDTARERLKDLQPSFQRGSYLAAFRQANTLLANSLGARKRIILCGDNQQNQWEENLNTPPFLQNVEVTLPRPAATQLPNLSLSDARVQRVFLGAKSLVNFTVKLTHTGPARAAKVELRANGQVVFGQSLDLEKQPETILLQSQWEADPAVWLRGEVSVEGAPDALAGDNHLFFSMAPMREGKVALLAQSPYLRLALSPDIMQGHWAARVLEPARVAEEVSGNHDAEVLVIESAYLQSADARKLVWRYLTNGRGVLLLVNRVTPVISGALRELGFEAQADGLVEQTGGEPFQFVFSNHPIFHPFLSPEYGNLMEVRVLKHARLKVMQGMPLIFSGAGDALFSQGSKLPGRLFVSAFGFDRAQTTWPVHQTFIPFLDICLQNCRPEDSAPLNYDPAAVSIINLPADSPVREVVLRGANTEVERVPVVQGKAQLRLPDKPGLYEVSFDGQSEPEKVLSVNPSPKESQLVYAENPEAMKVWQLARGAPPSNASAVAGARAISLAGILQQRIWWWLVLAGLAALLLETIWSAARREHA